VTEARSLSIVGIRVDATDYGAATDQIADWANNQESRYVTASSVNNVVQALDSPSFRDVMNAADMVTPDGMPLVWAAHALGVQDASRVYGPELTLHVCERAARDGIPIGLYGGTDPVLRKLIANLRHRYPALQIVYSWAPPFRELSPEEAQRIDDEIVASGARIVLVGLGTPKQEEWIVQRRGRIDAVMLGVGAAFDFIAGEKKQAPAWMQKRGLEWLFRLSTEPKRLWKRYLLGNPRFIAHFSAQLLRTNFSRDKGIADDVEREGKV
jgi:N-acetylglucosaminyldiphosphoundecaprenol N-acetyl-beta-D-mannosaminyltransferase